MTIGYSHIEFSKQSPAMRWFELTDQERYQALVDAGMSESAAGLISKLHATVLAKETRVEVMDIMEALKCKPKVEEE